MCTNVEDSSTHEQTIRASQHKNKKDKIGIGMSHCTKWNYCNPNVYYKIKKVLPIKNKGCKDGIKRKDTR